MCSTIAGYYDGRSVFVTGSTGILGKVFLEKLLYSCPGIEKVYILIRAKKNMTPEQRIAKMLEKAVFSRLKAEKPKAIEKIVPIVGNVSESRLGIKIDDEEILIEKVSVVFHLAAVTRFTETLDVSINDNVLGTKRVLDLCHRMKHIKTFVYVSTAFSNHDKRIIEEVVYPAPITLAEVEKLLKIGLTEEQTNELVGDKRNTYMFSKALAEDVVAQNHGNIPSVIIRPAIVSCCKDEPVVGWIDGWVGASGIITAIAKGLIRVMIYQPSNILNLIPADYVSNLIIVAATTCKSSEDVLIYNLSTNEDNPLTYKQCYDLIITHSIKQKLYNTIRPMLYVTQSKWIMKILQFILHILPAFVMDALLFLSGNNTRYLKIQSKLSTATDLMDAFNVNHLTVRTSKTIALYDSLSPSDKMDFPFNHQDIDWTEYIPNYLKGMKMYLWEQ